MNSIIFNKEQGGLGRPLQGEDHISGLLMYIDSGTATLPSGFSSTAREKVVYSLVEAEALGIAKGSSTHGALHYHISEFFRMQPLGELWLGIYDEPTGTYDFNEIKSLQYAAANKIRQVAVFAPQIDFTSTFTISSTAFHNNAQVNNLQTVATALYTENKPLIILYAPNVPRTTALTALLDLTTLEADSVSVVIGQDGAADGAALFGTTHPSVTCVGAVLGAVSAALVSENIGWIQKFNFSNGNELDVITFSNGVSYTSLSEGQLSAVDAKGYIFLRKHVGINGSYVNDSHTAVADTSDFAYLENQRTIQKAIRSMRTYLLPALSGPLDLKKDGTLSHSTAKYYETLCQKALDQMQRDGEISAYTANVNPAQNVLSSSKLVIGILVIPVGIARQIEVNIGFTLSIN